VIANSKAASWLVSRRAMSVALLAALLFLTSCALDQILYWRGISGAQTLSNDLAIAILGGAALWFILTLQAERQEFAHARERMKVTAELNHHIRRAMSVVASSVVIENEEDRLRLVDQAVEHIDQVLMNLVPTATEQDRLRFYLEQTR
jgi:hypothetical protein